MRVLTYSCEIRHGTLSKHKYLVYKWTFQSLQCFVQTLLKLFQFGPRSRVQLVLVYQGPVEGSMDEYGHSKMALITAFVAFNLPFPSIPVP